LRQNAGRKQNCLGKDQNRIILPTGKNLPDAQIESRFISKNVYIVHYDEQFPREGRCQKFRLTILDAKTKQKLADELFDDKSPETIKQFLISKLDTSEPIFVVTDFGTSYPKVLKEVFGDKLLHQYCLLHLNKLIVNDFPKKTTIAQELLKYRLLNIF
jgi:hypothetical protein